MKIVARTDGWCVDIRPKVTEKVAVAVGSSTTCRTRLAHVTTNGTGHFRSSAAARQDPAVDRRKDAGTQRSDRIEMQPFVDGSHGAHAPCQPTRIRSVVSRWSTSDRASAVGAGESVASCDQRSPARTATPIPACGPTATEQDAGRWAPRLTIGETHRYESEAWIIVPRDFSRRRLRLDDLVERPAGERKMAVPLVVTCASAFCT